MGGWDSLLQGAIGSVLGSALGVFGAFYAAIHTIRKAQQNERVLLREQVGVRAAGEIGTVLLMMYDSLRQLLLQAGDVSGDTELTVPTPQGSIIRDLLNQSSRLITLEGTLLPRDLANSIGNLRDAMREEFGVTTPDSVTKGKLVKLQKHLREATDELREYRRQSYQP